MVRWKANSHTGRVGFEIDKPFTFYKTAIRPL